MGIYLHRPALLNFGDAIPGSAHGDTVRGHWSAWLMSVDLWPLQSDVFLWPDGGGLLPLPPISLAIVAPITRFLGASTGLSFLVFLHSILLMLSCYWMCKLLTMRSNYALIGALLAGSTPMLAETLHAGVYEYQTLGWLILSLCHF